MIQSSRCGHASLLSRKALRKIGGLFCCNRLIVVVRY
nr:MAG TPA: hypothetical protein [Caudoviricetes sp.]